MSETWKKIDLEGGGVHAVNLEFVRRQKKLRSAYWLWLLFPLGGHRIYLESKRASTLFAAATTLGFILIVTLGAAGAWIWLAETAVALWDLRWIAPRVTQLNKELRMALYLQNATAPPKGYCGRYDDTSEHALPEYTALKEGEMPGVGTAPGTAAEPKRRHPSFNEQEAMLRDLATIKNKNSKKPP